MGLEFASRLAGSDAQFFLYVIAVELAVFAAGLLFGAYYVMRNLNRFYDRWLELHNDV